MSIRDLNWTRRRTTVEDLLDDGIENASDLGKAPLDTARPPDPEALQKRSETLAKVKAERAAQLSATRRKSFSVFGVLLGLLVATGGCLLVMFPTDMRVEHSRIRYLPTVWEHVTPARSRLYGSVGIAFGLALVVCSLYRPRS
jgi:hypothetical protein